MVTTAPRDANATATARAEPPAPITDARAPVHVLLIPREHIPSVNALQPQHAATIGKLYLSAKKLAGELGVADSGYRLVMNCGPDAGQSVDHIHLHLLGGKQLAG